MQCLKQLGVEQIAPCHCTGNKAIAQIKDFWGKGFLEASAGLTVTISPEY